MARQKFVKKFVKKIKEYSNEPEVKQFTKTEMIQVLSWYKDRCFNPSVQKGWVLEHTKNKNLKNINEKFFTSPLTTLCRLISRGYKPTKVEESFITRKITDILLIKEDKEEIAKEKDDKETIQDRMFEQARVVMAEIDFFVDEVQVRGVEHGITTLLNDKNFGKPHTQFLIKYIEKYIEEFSGVKDGKSTDKELFDGYGLSVRKLNIILKYLEAIKSECQSWIMAKKKVKTQTIKKPKYRSPEEICKLVKVSPNTKVHPTKILNRLYTVVYNEKYNKLTVLFSTENEYLSIKGTTVVNVDDKLSKVYSIRAKHKDTFMEIFDPKLNVKDVIDKLKGDPFKESKATANGRLNVDSIILV